MNNRIEKRVELNAPVSRVWRALTDHREFGEWFRVKIDGPFVPGQVSRGQITYPGYEHVSWEMTFRLEPKGGGTLLVLRESGFDAIPQHRRFDALRMNERGWTEQMKNIERHVTRAS